jgi:hypothetical protein
VQVATEHADAFPDLGPVVVKSFQVLIFAFDDLIVFIFL